MAEVQIGAIDPIGAFNKQIAQMIELSEAFKAHGNITGLDYLRAMQMARENCEALFTMLFASIMADAGEDDRITPEMLSEHRLEYQIMMDNLTEEEKAERIHKALHRIAKHITINTSDDEKKEE